MFRRPCFKQCVSEYPSASNLLSYFSFLFCDTATKSCLHSDAADCCWELTSCLSSTGLLSYRGHLNLARSLICLGMLQVVQQSTPLNDPYTYKGAANALRSYHGQAWRGPERFCVVGDAFCVLNPRFGNGMTVAALMAEQLGKSLEVLQPFIVLTATHLSGAVAAVQLCGGSSAFSKPC